jgi:hypothetical protein
MAWDMPVQDLRQAHLDHLTDEQRHIVDPLRDDNQFIFFLRSPWPVDPA